MSDCFSTAAKLVFSVGILLNERMAKSKSKYMLSHLSRNAVFLKYQYVLVFSRRQGSI